MSKKQLNAELQKTLGEIKRLSTTTSWEMKTEGHKVLEPEDIVSVSDVDINITRIAYLKAHAESLCHILAKIEDGTYGVCSECGEKIAAKRLAAEPCADLCVSCKEKTEKTDRNRRLGQRTCRARHVVY
jgi:DnaK suppressor protein